MHRYNPFPSPLGELETSDLRVLRDCSEGWYVEYKERVTDIKTIAKSVSAFANHYGGWLIVGVRQSADGKRTAGSFPGIPLADLPKLEQMVRDAVAAHVNPPPYYEHRILSGPEDGLGLGHDRAVLVVAVPAGPWPPYVHSTGKIYRRVGDASDPKPETDRAVLDLLWKRGQQGHRRLHRQFDSTPLRSKAEDDVTYIHVFLTSDPLGDRGHRSRMGFERFAALMNDGRTDLGGLPFENVFTTSDGLVARQTGNNDPYNLVMTWRCRRDAWSVVSLPVGSAAIDDQLHGIGKFLIGYEHTEKFLALCRRLRVRSGWVIDLNLLFQVLCGITTKHRALASEDGYEGPFFAKAHLETTWRRMPFLDTSAYIAFASTQGLPLVQDDAALVPPGEALEGMVHLDARRWPVPPADQLAVAAEDGVSLFLPIAAALGLPGSVIRESAADLQPALQRALQVQKSRRC